jgi:hypothetical protein
MIGTADRGPDPQNLRLVDPATHYLRTFEHLAPGTPSAPRPGRPRRRWVGIAVLGVLALSLLRRPAPEEPPARPERRAPAPRIALAPTELPPVAPAAPRIVPDPPRVVERQGPKLIERLLAEKLGTPPPAASEPTAPAEKPAVKPVVVDRPALAEKRAAEKAVELAAAKAREAERRARRDEDARRRQDARLAQQEAERARRDAEAAAAPESRPTPVVVAKQVVVAAPVAQRAVRAPADAAADRRPAAVVERVLPAPEIAAQPPVATAAVSRIEAAPAGARTAARPASPRSTGPSSDAVRSLLDRYAAAWRGHDVDTLRAIGQVTSDGQANALRQYFANVGDLEVEVHVLDIRTDGDRATVRFTRRDRFRDPAGRQIAKESPPIEKHVVTTPQGLRFAPAS